MNDSLSNELLGRLATVRPHGRLGVRGAKFLVAPAHMSTCVDCERGLNCTFNLDRHTLAQGYLTTGYYEGKRLERIDSWFVCSICSSLPIYFSSNQYSKCVHSSHNTSTTTRICKRFAYGEYLSRVDNKTCKYSRVMLTLRVSNIKSTINNNTL